MFVRAFLSAVILCCVATNPSNADGKKVPIPAKIVGKLPQMIAGNPAGILDAVNLLATLTESGDEIRVLEVLKKSSSSQSELNFFSEEVVIPVVVKRHNWFGTVELQLRVPAKISYSMGLDSGLAARAQFDANKKILTVPLGVLKASSVEPQLDRIEDESYAGGLRFKWFNDGTFADMKLSALTSDFPQEAKLRSEYSIGILRPHARERMAQHLSGFFNVVDPKIRVVVED